MKNVNVPQEWPRSKKVIVVVTTLSALAVLILLGL